MSNQLSKRTLETALNALKDTYYQSYSDLESFENFSCGTTAPRTDREMTALKMRLRESMKELNEHLLK